MKLFRRRPLQRHAIHETAAIGFERAAGEYERARAGYPADAVEFLVRALALSQDGTVLDLGAGTGKLTRELAARGVRCIAVEPVSRMRRLLAQALPQVWVFNGTAEDIPLEGGSVEGIVCAQAFHWFRYDDALPEIHRVLRPGGRLALVWNVRDERVDWVRRVTEIIDPHQGDVELPRYRHGSWRRAMADASSFFVQEAQRDFVHTQSMPAAMLLDRVASMSFIAVLEPQSREAVLDKVRDLLATHPDLRGHDEIVHPYVTEVYVYRRV